MQLILWTEHFSSDDALRRFNQKGHSYITSGETVEIFRLTLTSTSVIAMFMISITGVRMQMLL